MTMKRSKWVFHNCKIVITIIVILHRGRGGVCLAIYFFRAARMLMPRATAPPALHPQLLLALRVRVNYAYQSGP